MGGIGASLSLTLFIARMDRALYFEASTLVDQCKRLDLLDLRPALAPHRWP